MVLCCRCQLSKTMQPCLIGGRKPCLVCQEDIELQRTIQELQEKRRILRSQMNAIHDPFVLAFPPEISSQIFLLSMEKWNYKPYDAQTRNLDTILRKLPTPFLLGTVCRGWRQLARATPHLWTTLSLTLAKPTKIFLPQAVSDWLQLSGSLPLAIWIFYKWNKPSSQEICLPVIDIVNQHSKRWRKVVIRHIPPDYLNRFCGTSPPSSLYDLEVRNCRIDGPPESPLFRMNSKASPTNLIVQKIGFSANSIGWDNLLSLVMQDSTVEECMEIIQRAPLLESCTLLDFNPALSSIPKTIFRHMYLRMLDVLWDWGESFVNLIDALECPSLEYFSFKSNINHKVVDSLISLFKRSGSCLKELKLHGLWDFQLTVEDFRRLYNAVPNLQRLDLHWNEGDGLATVGDLFQQLSSSAPILEGRTPRFLPHLESLTLHLRTLDFRSPAGAGRHIPHIYSSPHRKILSLELSLMEIKNDDHASTKLSNLIAKGINIRILKNGNDYLQNIQVHAQQPSLANPPT